MAVFKMYYTVKSGQAIKFFPFEYKKLSRLLTCNPLRFWKIETNFSWSIYSYFVEPSYKMLYVRY